MSLRTNLIRVASSLPVESPERAEMLSLLAASPKTASTVVSISDGIGQGCYALIEELRDTVQRERGDIFKKINAAYGGHHAGASFEAEFANQLNPSDTGYLLCKVSWNHNDGKPEFACVMNWGRYAKPVSAHFNFDMDLNQSKFVARVWGWLEPQLDSFTHDVSQAYNRAHNS